MYNFYWYGKESAIKESYGFTNDVLVEDKESSRNWDDTENLYIEGDNLKVLKLLQKSYFGKIKMIYIDPPYNTGKDFVYKDNFRNSIANYKEIIKQKNKVNSETNGRYHTDWLNMMYPRLKLARNLLKKDGVIFISIDDNEVHNLRKICDEIFGEDNFVANIVWEKNFAPKNDHKYISENHEHCLVYAKSKEKYKRILLPRSDENNKGYSNPDNDPRGLWTSGTMLATTYNQKYVFGFRKPNGEMAYPSEGRCWRYSLDKINELIKDNRIWFGKDGSNVPRVKRFLSEVPDGIVPMTLWKHTEVSNNQNATNALKQLLDGKQIFQFSKPVEYISKMMNISIEKEDIVLDFFSGSATTAHAVMNLNSQDNGNRKFIMVQLPELTDEKSEAYKAGYKNICEIGKERIRRAGEKIMSENKDKEGIKKLDIGFKVFKLKEGNMFQKLQKEILNGDSIKIEIIKRPKIKGLEKIKIDNETYCLFEDETYYKVFNYSKGQNEVIASIFSKEECKNVSYMELERVYTDVLVDFNKGWYHSNYVTVRILDEIYKKLQH